MAAPKVADSPKCFEVGETMAGTLIASVRFSVIATSKGNTIMKYLAYTTAVVALLATAGLGHAQESNTQQPAAQAPADCPAPGSVPEAQIPENCKTSQTQAPVDPNAEPANQNAVTTDPAIKPADQTTTTATDQPADSTKAAAMIDPSSAFLASNFIGQTVYSAANENVGEINDLIMDKDKGAVVAIVGVGGFLGMGEKDVAVPLDNITATKLENNDLKLTITTSRVDLEAAPAFDRSKLTMSTGG
ncbi:MAG: PRC-barrel domain-containing protein [Aestuariivirga sp.]